MCAVFLQRRSSGQLQSAAGNLVPALPSDPGSTLHCPPGMRELLPSAGEVGGIGSRKDVMRTRGKGIRRACCQVEGDDGEGSARLGNADVVVQRKMCCRY